MNASEAKTAYQNGSETATIAESKMLSLIKGETIKINATTVENNGFIKTNQDGSDALQIIAANQTNNGAIKAQNIYLQGTEIRNFGTMTFGNLNLIAPGGVVVNAGTLMGGAITTVAPNIQFTGKSVTKADAITLQTNGKIQSDGTVAFGVLLIDGRNATVINNGAWSGSAIQSNATNVLFTGKSVTKADTIALQTNGTVQSDGKLTFGTLILDASKATVVSNGTLTGTTIVGSVGNGTFSSTSVTKVANMALKTSGNIEADGRLDSAWQIGRMLKQKIYIR